MIFMLLYKLWWKRLGNIGIVVLHLLPKFQNFSLKISMCYSKTTNLYLRQFTPLLL